MCDRKMAGTTWTSVDYPHLRTGKALSLTAAGLLILTLQKQLVTDAADKAVTRCGRMNNIHKAREAL